MDLASRPCHKKQTCEQYAQILPYAVGLHHPPLYRVAFSIAFCLVKHACISRKWNESLSAELLVGFSITKPKFCVGRSPSLLEGLPFPPFVRPFFPIRSASAIPFDTKMKAPSPSLPPSHPPWTSCFDVDRPTAFLKVAKLGVALGEAGPPRRLNIKGAFQMER